MTVNNTMGLDSCVLITTNTLNCFCNPWVCMIYFTPICIPALIRPVYGGLTKCLMFLGHLVDLVQWFNQWRIKFGFLPKDQIRCQQNEAICWECVSEVAMQQTDNHICKWIQLFLQLYFYFRLIIMFRFGFSSTLCLAKLVIVCMIGLVQNSVQLVFKVTIARAKKIFNIVRNH